MRARLRHPVAIGAIVVNVITIAKLAAVATTALVLGFLLLGGYSFGEVIDNALGLITTAGPVSFFLAMAVLPAIGVPVSLFTISAGAAFGPELGIHLVLLFSLTAIALNMALGYLLANRALRPVSQRLILRLGYRIPSSGDLDATGLVIFLRATPGIPFPLQNVLLGLADVPFARYLLVSCCVALPLNAAIILFGKSILEGKGGMALFGFLLMMGSVAMIRVVRRHYVRKSKPPALGGPDPGHPG